MITHDQGVSCICGFQDFSRFSAFDCWRTFPGAVCVFVFFHLGQEEMKMRVVARPRY